jgi:hypothetical protein
VSSFNRDNRDGAPCFGWSNIVRFRAAENIPAVLFNTGIFHIALFENGYNVGITYSRYLNDFNAISGELSAEMYPDGGLIIDPQIGYEGVYFKSGQNGMFFTVLVGVPIISGLDYKKPDISARTDLGYQFVTHGGFVFTPALGAKYNPVDGIGLDLMLDIGFAFGNYL